MQEIMKDFINQWNEIENRITQVNEDAKAFGKSAPKFPMYNKLQGELN
jgi:hypothetical protein